MTEPVKSATKTIGETLAELFSNIKTCEQEIYPRLDTPSVLNLDIIFKQFEAEGKFLLKSAMLGSKEEFDNSVKILREQTPTVVNGLIESSTKILDEVLERVKKEEALADSAP